MRRTLTPAQKKYVLERDDYICAYCLGNAEIVEHVIPFAYSYCDDFDNLVAACKECNSIAGDFVFDNFDEKSEYIRTKRSGRKWSRKLRRKQPIHCINCNKKFVELNNGATLFLCPVCTKKEYR